MSQIDGDTERALGAVADERFRQILRWDEDDRHPMGLWLAILGKQVGGLSEMCLDPVFSPAVKRSDELHAFEAERLRERAVKVAAVAVAIIEQMDARLESLSGAIEHQRAFDRELMLADCDHEETLADGGAGVTVCAGCGIEMTEDEEHL